MEKFLIENFIFSQIFEDRENDYKNTLNTLNISYISINGNMNLEYNEKFLISLFSGLDYFEKPGKSLTNKKYELDENEKNIESNSENILILKIFLFLFYDSIPETEINQNIINLNEITINNNDCEVKRDNIRNIEDDNRIKYSIISNKEDSHNLEEDYSIKENKTHTILSEIEKIIEKNKTNLIDIFNYAKSLKISKIQVLSQKNSFSQIFTVNNSSKDIRLHSNNSSFEKIVENNIPKKKFSSKKNFSKYLTFKHSKKNSTKNISKIIIDKYEGDSIHKRDLHNFKNFNQNKLNVENIINSSKFPLNNSFLTNNKNNKFSNTLNEHININIFENNSDKRDIYIKNIFEFLEILKTKITCNFTPIWKLSLNKSNTSDVNSHNQLFIRKNKITDKIEFLILNEQNIHSNNLNHKTHYPEISEIIDEKKEYLQTSEIENYISEKNLKKTNPHYSPITNKIIENTNILFLNIQKKISHEIFNPLINLTNYLKESKNYLKETNKNKYHSTGTLIQENDNFNNIIISSNRHVEFYGRKTTSLSEKSYNSKIFSPNKGEKRYDSPSLMNKLSKISSINNTNINININNIISNITKSKNITNYIKYILDDIVSILNFNSKNILDIQKQSEKINSKFNAGSFDFITLSMLLKNKS